MSTARLGWLVLAAVLAGAMGCKHAPPPDTTGELLIEPTDARALGFLLAGTNTLAVPRDVELTEAIFLDDMVLMFESPNNVATAISAKDGHTLWAAALGVGADPLVGAIRSKNRLFINSQTQIFALTASRGKFVARANLETAVSGGPALFEDYAIFGGTGGKVFAHDLTAGFSKWSYQLSGDIAVQPVVTGAAIFVATMRGEYLLLTASNGELNWRERAHEAIAGQPVSTPVGILVPSLDGTLYCVNRTTGRDKWRYLSSYGLNKGPTVLNGVVYQPISDGDLAALDLNTGKELWRVHTTAEVFGQTDRGLLAQDKTRLQLLDPATGRPTLEVPIRRSKFVVPVGGSSFILIAPDGRIQRLDPLK